MGKENLSFDLRHYKKGTAGFEADLVALTLEHQAEPESERITPYILKFNSQGEVVGFKPRWDTEKDFAENMGLYSMRDLALKGEKYLVWISPASERYRYAESRMVVGEVKQNKEGVVIDCRSLCIQEGGDYCLEVAKKLGYQFEESEQLRAQALAFDGDGEGIFYLERVINRPDIWVQIKSGEDKRGYEQRKKKIKNVVEYFEPRIKDSRDMVRLGAEIEWALMGLGIRLTAAGDCGVLNSSIVNLSVGTFDSLYLKVTTSEKYFECPRCKGKIESGKGIETCPHCGMTKQEAGSKCD